MSAWNLQNPLVNAFPNFQFFEFNHYENSPNVYQTYTRSNVHQLPTEFPFFLVPESYSFDTATL